MKVKFTQTPKLAPVEQPKKYGWRLHHDNGEQIASGAVLYNDWREAVSAFEVATGATVYIERQHQQDGAPVVYAYAVREITPQTFELAPGVAITDRDPVAERIDVEGLE